MPTPTSARVRRCLLVSVLGVAALCASYRDCLADKWAPEFNGNMSVGTRRLRRHIQVQLQRFQERDYAEAEIDDAAYFLTEFYRGRGYPFATVSYRFDPQQRPPAVTFEIKEGPLIRLTDVNFSGVEAFPEEDLEELILPLALFKKKPPFSEASLERGIRNVIETYREAGFQEVQLAEKRVEFDRAAGAARAYLTISEGPRYKITEIEIRGELIYPEAEVQKQGAKFLGKPFTLRAGTLIASSVRTFYMNRGHRFCEVSWDYAGDRSTGAAVITLDVEPGKSFTIREVKTQGLRRTRESYVTGSITIKPGQNYSRERESESYARLVRSGLFESINMEFEPVEEDQLNLTVRAREAKYRGTALSIGYGSYENLRLGVGVYDNNLLGLGKQGELGLGLSMVGESADVILRDPSLFGSSWQGQVRVFGTQREEPSFTREEYGVSLGTSRPVRRTARWFSRYEFSVSKATDIQPEAIVDSELIKVGILSGGFLRDARDNILNPSRGEYHSIQLDYGAEALGGDLDFLRFIYQFRQFWPLGGSVVGALGVNWSGIFPVGDTDVIPIQQRFFLGGATSVRSFQEGELGPKDSEGNPLGGEAFTWASAEVRFPIVQNLRGAVFADAGSVTREVEGLGFSRYSFALGAGLRYYLPIGPIRLDYGWNPDPEEDEDWSAWHLSVGFSF